jgi:hypothetical protein
MVDLSPEPEWLPVNDGVALLAHVLPHPVRLHLGVALVAQRPTLRTEHLRVTANLSPPRVTATIDTLGHSNYLRVMATTIWMHSGSWLLKHSTQGKSTTLRPSRSRLTHAHRLRVRDTKQSRIIVTSVADPDPESGIRDPVPF